MYDNMIVTNDCIDVSSFPSIRLCCYDETTDSSIRFDCAVNMECNAKDLLSVAVPERTEGIAKLTNCYLQAFRHAKNLGYESLVLPILGIGCEGWSIEESFHSLKSALMIHWRSGALDGEVFQNINLYLLSGNGACKEEILKFCKSVFSVFLCDLPDWNSKGNRRLWEHLMHVFSEKDVTGLGEFAEQVLAEYQDMTGCLLSEDERAWKTHYVASLDFGGEGGGMISDAFWMNICLPVLKKRFSEI